MFRAISCGLMIVALGTGTADVAQAQWGLPCFDTCNLCFRPACTGCAPRYNTVVAPPPVTTTHVQPVISTQYRQQQQISYHDVSSTEYRQESYYQSVPVTTYETVTVDEGGYQQVWVPKLVTKTVAKQGYQTQLSSRTVPYQVTRRIPQVTTQLIPEQRLSYQTSYTTSYLPPVTTTYNTSILPPIVAAPIATPVATAPAPRTSYNSSSYSQESLNPVPDPEFDEDGRATGLSSTTTIPKRAASADRYDGYRSADRRGSTQTAKKFVPAPSAAAVWRTPRNSVYR